MFILYKYSAEYVFLITFLVLIELYSALQPLGGDERQADRVRVGAEGVLTGPNPDHHIQYIESIKTPDRENREVVLVLRHTRCIQYKRLLHTKHTLLFSSYIFLFFFFLHVDSQLKSAKLLLTIHPKLATKIFLLCTLMNMAHVYIIHQFLRHTLDQVLQLAQPQVQSALGHMGFWLMKKVPVPRKSDKPRELIKKYPYVHTCTK